MARRVNRTTSSQVPRNPCRQGSRNRRGLASNGSAVEHHPMEVLVTAEIDLLRSQEDTLARTLRQLERGCPDPLGLDYLVTSLAEVQHRADRLAAMLEAMDGCGLGEHAETPPVPQSGLDEWVRHAELWCELSS